MGGAQHEIFGVLAVGRMLLELGQATGEKRGGVTHGDAALIAALLCLQKVFGALIAVRLLVVAAVIVVELEIGVGVARRSRMLALQLGLGLEVVIVAQDDLAA